MIKDVLHNDILLSPLLFVVLVAWNWLANTSFGLLRVLRGAWVDPHDLDEFLRHAFPTGHVHLRREDQLSYKQKQRNRSCTFHPENKTCVEYEFDPAFKDTSK